MTRIIILVAIIFSGISCNKECIELVNYEFELPATLSPAKDTFRIGDTITISSEFSDEVYDRATKRKYKLENFKFFPGSEVVQIDVIDAVPQFYSFFEFYKDTQYIFNFQHFSDGGDAFRGEYKYKNNRYKLEFKICPIKKGLYLFEFSSGLGYLGENQDFDGRCPKRHARLDAYIKMNDGADNNIQMLLDSPDPHYNDWIMQKPEKRFHQFGGYCFYVKE